MLLKILLNTSVILTVCLCHPVLANTKTNTFSDNGNSTVSDVAAGLMWQKLDDDVPRLYANAVDYCNGLILAGKSDWRLPSIKELSSIVDYRINSPSINTSIYPGTNLSPYWSITNRASSSNSAWVVLFENGRVTSSSKVGGVESPDVFVRCVRSVD